MPRWPKKTTPAAAHQLPPVAMTKAPTTSTLINSASADCTLLKQKVAEFYNSLLGMPTQFAPTTEQSNINEVLVQVIEDIAAINGMISEIQSFLGK